MDAQSQEVFNKFISLFGHRPMLVRSPGRINLIGEHTDYNDGFVMPAAIDKEVVFAIAPSNTGECVIYAVQYDESFVVDPERIEKVKEPKWVNYLLGVLHQFKERGHSIPPFQCVVGGSVPVGAGLSSSAAVECGFAFALNELLSAQIPKLQLITMAQWSEHHYAGVKCGIMDQFASMMGQANKVILLDCRSLEYKYFPIDMKDHCIILCDTRVKHSLVDSEYNVRRKECETGVSLLQKHYPAVRSLRDVTPDMLEAHRSEFPGKVYDRCCYIVQEIERVQQAAEDLNRGDLVSFGKKMYETHEGLSRLYEVSCKELDFLVEEARKHPGVLGARMMGGGFGGCTINIVQEIMAGSFEEQVKQAYKQTFSIDMPVYRVKIREGTGLVVGSTD